MELGYHFKKTDMELWTHVKKARHGAVDPCKKSQTTVP